MTPSRPINSVWPLRLATLLFVLGTARYVSRDSFHADDSTLQAVIELSSVLTGVGITIGAALFYRVKPLFRTGYVLLLLTFVLALVFSVRSWDPLLSVTRGALLVMLSLSAVWLVRLYGLESFVFRLLEAHLVLIAFGLCIGLADPTNFPLMLHDPGEEAVRSRLHLFQIHPIKLADDCATCLLLSVLFSGRWIRILRFVFGLCLLLTVTRASIIFGLPLYFVSKVIFRQNRRKGLNPTKVIWGLAAVPGIVALGLLLAYSSLEPIEELRTTVTHVFDATKDNVTLNGRTSLWQLLIADLSLDNIYGYGVGGARYYLRSVNPWFGQAHNSFLETIYSSGYIGALLIIAALATGLADCVRDWSRPQARAMAVTLAYLVAAGMMNPTWYEATALMVLAVACNRPGALVMAASRPVISLPLRFATSVAR
jgi:O-antigen ligase